MWCDVNCVQSLVSLSTFKALLQELCTSVSVSVFERNFECFKSFMVIWIHLNLLSCILSFNSSVCIIHFLCSPHFPLLSVLVPQIWRILISASPVMLILQSLMLVVEGLQSRSQNTADYRQLIEILMNTGSRKNCSWYIRYQKIKNKNVHH